MSTILQKTLEQILEVTFIVYKLKYDRIDAVNRVARKYRVTQNTITSACTRGISINTHELDEYLKIENAYRFENILIQRFPYYQKQIEEYFTDVLKKEILENPDEISSVVKQILPEELKFTIAKLYFNLMKNTFEEWTNRKDIPEDIRIQIVDWLKKFPEILG